MQSLSRLRIPHFVRPRALKMQRSRSLRSRAPQCNEGKRGIARSAPHYIDARSGGTPATERRLRRGPRARGSARWRSRDPSRPGSTRCPRRTRPRARCSIRDRRAPSRG